MTKLIIFLFAIFGTLQAHAGIQSHTGDTIGKVFSGYSSEMVYPVGPVYLDGVVVPAVRSGNWFVTLAGGASAFLGTPLGCEDLFGRIRPSLSLAVGKWFTPAVGARINYNGMQFRDGMLSSQQFHFVHADLMWNILGRRYARQETVRWTLAPYAGVGLIHHATNGHNPFAISYGIQGQYRISRRISFLMELGGTVTFQDFDGIGKPNRPGDNMVSLTAGFSFSIGRTGWKRAVDASPCLHQNEQLVGVSNRLIEANRNYSNAYERDRKALAELKKILEVEGLLDTYCHLFDSDSIPVSGYPRNNYSGLNSLMARLKNRKWNGGSVLDGNSAFNGKSEGMAADSASFVQDNGKEFAVGDSIAGIRNDVADTLSVSYMSLVRSGRECIGAPVYFFFELGTANLTDSSQLVNLDELARVALKYGLSVSVIGAADSATGTSDINDALGVSRADFIVAELKRRGLADEYISKRSVGGIARFTADEANRHTKVILLLN